MASSPARPSSSTGNCGSPPAPRCWSAPTRAPLPRPIPRLRDMNLSGIFITRPVMTTLVMTGVLLFGLVSYTQLPVSDLPNVDYPVISVSASLPGASPETMASAVATPLEKQFSTIAGLDAMTSSSNQGGTTITLQFTLDRDIDAAAQDVQAMIAKTLRSLPTGIIPPSYQKVNPADQAILLFALTSKLLPLSELDEYGETVLAQRISMVPGVAQVIVYGSQKYAVRVQLDPTALAYRKIGIDEVASAINNQNVNLPTGVLWGPTKAYTVQPMANCRMPRRSRGWSSATGMARRCGSAISGTCWTTFKTTRWPAGVTGRARSCSPSSASRERTQSRWRAR